MMNGDQPTTDQVGSEHSATGIPQAAPPLETPAEAEVSGVPAAAVHPEPEVVEGAPAESAAPPEITACETTGTEASGSETTAPVAAETAAATEVAATEDAAPADTTTEEVAVGEKRRIQLNPTVNEADVRAVPTYGSSDAAGDVAAAYLQPASTGPVELPRDAAINPELEAELAAAMAGTMESGPTHPAGEEVAGGANFPVSEDQLEPGAKLKAKVQSVTAENVFCEIGFRCPGLLPIKQFPAGKHPREGEEFLVVVDKFDNENGVVLVSLPKATRRPRGNWEELAVGQVVECVVNKTNKGGLEVTVSNMRAFLPASQVDVGFVSSLDGYVGQRFAVQITEVNPAKRNLVVSRRAIVIQERKELAATFWEQVEVGQQFAGTVKTLKDYGAFVDLGGVDGFLHVGEMSWTRIKHPSDILAEGQNIDVVVLSLDREKQKIGLGMRQLAQNPWNIAVEKYAVNTTVSGRVTRTADFGAFVELEPGVEGLIHISELDHRRVKRVGEVLNVGQEVQAQVLEVDPGRQRISLSLKALKAKPEEPKDEDLSPGKGQAYERKRKEPLRGGTGGSQGGGLFGNPVDFNR